MLLLQDRMQLAKRLEDRCLVRKIEIAMLGEQAFEYELVRRGSAETDVRVAVPDDLVVRPIVLRCELRVAECRQRVSGDGDGVAFANDDECCHASSIIRGGAGRIATRGSCSGVQFAIAHVQNSATDASGAGRGGCSRKSHAIARAGSGAAGSAAAPVAFDSLRPALSIATGT